MGTLAEIESAAEILPKDQQRELLLFLIERLRADGPPLPEPRLFSDAHMKAWMDEDEADMRRFTAGWGKALLEIAGTAEGLPPDFAENHDRYLRDAPKK